MVRQLSQLVVLVTLVITLMSRVTTKTFVQSDAPERKAEVVFGRRQIEVMLLLYRSVFLPRLLYNCEAWSNLSKNDIKSLQTSQLSYLRCVIEIPKSTPVAALHLELGILPVKYETEIKQLLFLKRILDKEANDPVLLSYQEMLKFGSEANWANNILGLRQAYNFPSMMQI